MTVGTTALQVEGVAASHSGVPALFDVSLSVAKGEIHGLLGHNGSGKSTLFSAVVGLLHPDRGGVRLDGADIRTAPAHARARLGMAYVPQGRGIFPHLTVRENLQFAALARFGKHDASAVDRVLDLFPNLTRLLAREGGTLSGGEQQLLSIARALVVRPWLLLMDEPTEGIQPSVVADIADTLVRPRKEEDLSILVAEQNYAFLSSVCDRATMIATGRSGCVHDRNAFEDGSLRSDFLSFQSHSAP